MQITFTKNTLRKLESLFESLGYTIRYEKGQFNSGYCLVQNRNMVVINKFYELQERIKTLVAVLQTLPITVDTQLDTVNHQYLKSIRKLDLFNPFHTKEAV